MDDDDEYTIPLQDQRVFGAGIKRKRIAFVPAVCDSSSSVEVALPQPSSSSSSSSIADRYLSIVLPTQPPPPPQEDNQVQTATAAESSTTKTSQCAVCRQPVTATATATTATAATATTTTTAQHEASIAHQVCLQHSQPPSHLDRRHVGVKYLAAYGWDPDSGRGLGARGEGIRMPVKAREKHDTVGLRERDDEDADADGNSHGQTKTQKQKQRQKQRQKQKEAKPMVRLNAKQVRKQEMAAKKRAEALRAALYNDVNVDQYLGTR